MQTKTTRTTKPRRKRDELSVKVALMTGYSYDYVRRVRDGEMHNGCIALALIELKLAEEESFKKVSELLNKHREEGEKCKKCNCTNGSLNCK